MDHETGPRQAGRCPIGAARIYFERRLYGDWLVGLSEMFCLEA